MPEELDSDTWVRRCVAHMVSLDPQLDPDLARPIAEDMSGRSRWREMGPESAALAVFEVGGRSRPDNV